VQVGSDSVDEYGDLFETRQKARRQSVEVGKAEVSAGANAILDRH
jgi:hypothetical protein